MADPSLLCRLGLRQITPWDPPTVLDRLLASPTRAAAHWLWTWLATVRRWRWQWWRQRWPAQKGLAPPIRVVCLSDTHDQIVPDVPAGDLLVHAGDLTNAGTPAALRRQLDWLAAQPHVHKVVVCGNHDTWFDPAARAVAKAQGNETAEAYDDDDDLPPSQHAGVHYLERSTTTLAFANGRQLTVYGAPDIPRCGGTVFAFQYDRAMPPWKNTVPADVDILVTHPPPRHHRDLGLGCAGLLRELWRVRPRLHIFGHVHWGAGRELLAWDAAQEAYETLLDGGDPMSLSAGRSIVLLGRLLLTAVVSTLLLPVPLTTTTTGSSSTTLLVNAAQMYGNTGRLGHNIQVVDL